MSSSVEALWNFRRDVYIKSEDTTDKKYGSYPKKRPIWEYIKKGVINIDKPRGPTSHEVVHWVKSILSINKAGHSGTLDPKVSGVLPVALEHATKVLESIFGANKEYIAVMYLHSKVSRKKLKEVVDEFVGEIYQRPPVKSAVSRRLRVRKIYYIKILGYKDNDVLLKIGCEAGTYIRKLLFDMGEVLGVGANMSELRRTRVLNFIEDEAYSLYDLKDAYEYFKQNSEEDELRKIIKPQEYLVSHLPKIIIRDSAVSAICHGASLASQGVLKIDSGIEKNGNVAIMSQKGELIALAKSNSSTMGIFSSDHGIVAKPYKVIMERDIYPKKWKTEKK